MEKEKGSLAHQRIVESHTMQLRYSLNDQAIEDGMSIWHEYMAWLLGLITCTRPKARLM